MHRTASYGTHHTRDPAEHLVDFSKSKSHVQYSRSRQGGDAVPSRRRWTAEANSPTPTAPSQSPFSTPSEVHCTTDRPRSGINLASACVCWSSIRTTASPFVSSTWLGRSYTNKELEIQFPACWVFDHPWHRLLASAADTRIRVPIDSRPEVQYLWHRVSAATTAVLVV